MKEKGPADRAGFEKLLQLMRAEYAEAETAANESFEKGADRSTEIRRKLTTPGGSGKERLALADEQLVLQQRAFLHKPSWRVSQRIFAASAFTFEIRDRWWPVVISGICGARRETGGFARPAVRSTPDDMRKLLNYIEGAAEWAHSAVARELGEVQRHYAQVEPLAEGLIDDVLRSSPVLPLASQAELLTRDADRLAGRRHQLLDLPGGHGIRGLNPGIALSTLDIISDDQAVQIEPDRIYIIPATLADLKPMKGILTLDSGNALSHAQLLAANLGIPNATIPSSLLPELQKYRGQEMFYAVTQSGTVVLRPWSRSQSGRASQLAQDYNQPAADHSRYFAGESQRSGIENA